jgi:integrase
MSLYRRNNKSGKSDIWLCRIVVDGAVHQFSTRSNNKNLARSIEAKKRTELVKGQAGLLTAPTLSAFATRFINSLYGRVSKQTFRFYVCHLKAIIGAPAGGGFEPLAECRLDRIDAALLQDFITWRRKSVSTVTVNHNLRTLRRALHLAVEWNVISKVPKIRLLPHEHQRDYVISEDAVSRFAEEKELIGKIVPFLVDTGLRRGEIVGLGWDNVNFSERYIQIAKGKTASARRKVPLTKRAEAVLKALPKCDERVFTLNGHKITIDWISHAFLRARKRLKLPDGCVLHSTRHTFCTRLGERGADAFAIQRLAGHSSITISQRYVHPSAGRLDAAIALLD